MGNPVALVGFTLALFLREVPLRDIGNNAADLGDGFAMPTTQTPEEMLEIAIGRLMRGEPGMRLRSIALRPDCRLDVAELWALLRINRYQRALGIARITDIGDQFGIPYEVLEPTFDRRPGRLRATRYRPLLAHPGRRPRGRLRHVAAAGLDRRQTHPRTEFPRPARPGASRGRAQPDHAPDRRTTGVGRGAAGRLARPCHATDTEVDSELTRPRCRTVRREAGKGAMASPASAAIWLVGPFGPTSQIAPRRSLIRRA